MVPVCQISLITLSVLSGYLLLYTCVEYHTRLCQTIRRGRGENDNQNFFWTFIFSPSTQRVALGRTGCDGHWVVCVKASVLQSSVLPDTNTSSPALRALRYLADSSQDQPRAPWLQGGSYVLTHSAPQPHRLAWTRGISSTWGGGRAEVCFTRQTKGRSGGEFCFWTQRMSCGTDSRISGELSLCSMACIIALEVF